MQITDKDLQKFRDRAKTELQSNGAVGRLAWDSVVDALCNEVEELRKNAAPGNAAAMREALEQALAYCESDQRSGIAYSDNDVLVPILRAALRPRAGDEPRHGNGGRE